MPRQSYYQEVGNPIQRELLPHRQMSLTLPITDATADERAWQLFKVVGIVAARCGERGLGDGAWDVEEQQGDGHGRGRGVVGLEKGPPGHDGGPPEAVARGEVTYLEN